MLRRKVEKTRTIKRGLTWLPRNTVGRCRHGACTKTKISRLGNHAMTARRPGKTWLPKMLSISYIFFLIEIVNVTITVFYSLLNISVLYMFRLLFGNAVLFCGYSSSTGLVIGLSNLEPLLVNTVTDRIWSWSSVCETNTLAIGHLFLGD